MSTKGSDISGDDDHDHDTIQLTIGVVWNFKCQHNSTVNNKQTEIRIKF